ncbi:MAG TPA: hypothetical protein DDW50_00345, partial [Firmicutes bacterium]|nr:hypothetical protein [Bacillota bacterium]
MAINKNPDVVQGILDSYHIASDYQARGSVYFTPLANPSYVLKPLRIGAIRSYLTGALLNHKKLSGIVPHLIKPESGGYYRWKHGNRYLLTEIIQGRVADYTCTKDLKVAVATMAIFHRICREIILSEPQRWDILRFNPLCQWRKCLREMEICRDRAIRSQKDFFSRQYIQMWHAFYDMAFHVLQEFPNQSFPAQETICYHDWAFHNV